MSAETRKGKARKKLLRPGKMVAQEMGNGARYMGNVGGEQWSPSQQNKKTASGILRQGIEPVSGLSPGLLAV